MRRGFGLAELLVGVSLLGLLLALAVLNLQTTVGSSHSQGLAQVVAAELRQAQQRAIAAQTPVAVAIPSANATLPCSRSLYWAAGRSRAQVVSNLDLSREFPRACLFQGLWPLASGNTSATLPNLNLHAAPQIDLNNWLPGTLRRDHCLIFLPNGNVHSNGLPLFNGCFHWVACNGVEFAPASLVGAPTPAPPYFSPTSLSQPWTISVSSLGQINLVKGLQGQDGSVAIRDSTTSGAMAALVNPQVLGPSSPVLNQIETLPHPPVGYLPPGINISVSPDKRATLQVYANDPSGRDLFAHWTGDGGNFTLAGPDRMHWDDQNQRWTSLWDWFPPLGAAPGTDFHLECSLGDGVNATILPGSSQDIAISPVSTITMLISTGADAKIVRINSDGTNRVETSDGDVSNIGPLWYTSTNADGSLSLAGGSFGMALLGPDGKTLQGYYNDPPQGIAFRGPWLLSPHGSKILTANHFPFINFPAGRYNLTVMNADGSGETALPIPGNASPWSKLLNGDSRMELYSWSPDQRQVLYRRRDTSPSQLCLVNITGGSEQVLPLSPSQVGSGALIWGRDGFLYFDDPVTDLPSRIRPDGTGLSNIPLGTPAGLKPVMWSMSSDCQRLVMVLDDPTNQVWTQDINGSNPVHLTQIQDGSLIWNIHWGS